MRIITEKAASAFINNQSFRLANTSVHVAENCTTLKLHGNSIARKNRITGELDITTACWPTTTTKSRLNGLPGVRVYTTRGQLMLNGIAWDGNWITV